MFAAVGFQADDKESVMERPLHEPPQNVGDNVFFSALFILPFSAVFAPPPSPQSLLSLFISLTLLSYPTPHLPPSTTLSVYSAFTQAAQWAALPCRGNCWGVGPNSISGSRHVMYPHSGGSEAGILLRFGLGVFLGRF